MPRFVRCALVLVALVGALVVGLRPGFAAGEKESEAGAASFIHGSLVIAADGEDAFLYPGSSSTVRFTFDNRASGRQLLGTIHLASIVACDPAFVGGACPAGHEITSCESINDGASSNAGTANFYMADIVANQDFPKGNDQTVTAAGTLTMNNLASNQDSCKNANLLLNFTS
jgi:hypothetical protein